MRPMIIFRRFLRQPAAVCLSLSLLALTAGCGSPEPANDGANIAEPADQPATNLADRVPRPEAPLDRAALLAAVAQAASAATLRQDDNVIQRALDGKQFEIRIRFGCSGPAEDLRATGIGWTYDADGQVLRVRAMPTLGTDDPLVRSITPEQIETVEGFWLRRPWVLQAACPRPAPQPPAEPDAGPGEERQGEPKRVPEQKKREPQPKQQPQQPQASSAPIQSFPRIGIAQFFAADDSRAIRRDGRAYQATKTLEAPANGVGDQGFDLVLSGRLRAVPGGAVIRCVPNAAEAPPDCIVGAQFDRVWIERPQTRELIAEWANS